MLSRSSQVAIAAMGHMAEVYSEPGRRLSPAAIADSRQLQAPFVAKVLTILSRANLIDGTRGPGGGYCLSREPAAISLKEITALFEREDDTYMCPYGKDYCGNGPRCPLHDQISALNARMDKFLAETTLERFAKRFKGSAGDRRTSK